MCRCPMILVYFVESIRLLSLDGVILSQSKYDYCRGCPLSISLAIGVFAPGTISLIILTQIYFNLDLENKKE